ncbi:MAG: PD40 domain-containing protein [Blastocatellales bacterium]|nr:PD40 domain-containing protein [Blastocatellales bacterium]
MRTIFRMMMAAFFAVAVTASAAAQTKLLRFPDIHGDRVVFTYGGDLWTASTGGGTATRLTAHPGLELFAKFSPDGRWIAFTGQYDGDEQVYVIPSTGGEPKQLTFYPARGPLSPRWGYDNQVYGWTADGRSILFRSHRDSWTLPETRLYTAPAAGGPAEALLMPESGAGAYSPDGSRIVYSPRFRDFRSEKRYGGGQANDLFIFDLKSYSVVRVTDHPRADRDPMWIGGSIYFTSDRDGKFNIYAYDVASARTAAVTAHRDWDVRWPSADREGRIVYELNGELRIYDTKGRKDRALSITVLDDGLARRAGRVAAGNLIFDASLSPKGERALFAARGDIFTVPVEKGPTRNLTRSSNAHDKWPRWSPDGSRIAFVSDRSGEDEIYLAAQDGSGALEQLTSNGRAMRYAPEWSSDGKHLAFGDKDGKLFVLGVADRRLTEIVDTPRGQIRDYVWSPRGDFLAFSQQGENGYSSIYIWSAGDGSVRRVTGEMFNETSPVWDPAGNYLYFLSQREFAPQISNLEFNFAGNRSTGIFALALRRDVKHPFPAESDEVTVTKPDEAKKTETPAAAPTSAPTSPPTSAATSAAPGAPADLKIDFEGVEGRVARVPVAADNYFGLSAKNGYLLYATGPAFFYGRGGDRPPALKLFSLRDRRETVLGEGIGGYVLSRDGNKVMVAQGGAWQLFDATPQGVQAKKNISTAGMFVDRVPAEEWEQIFNEVWRRYRDWFYVPNMHGYDWEALRRQYQPWLKHVAHRSDLNYVISEMIAELTVQHAYIDGGDFQIPPRPRAGLPGARLELDGASGRYRIAKIFGGQNEEDLYRSPLTEIGVDAKTGDYVLAVDGVELKADEDPYRLFRNRADNPVQLTLNDRPVMEGARTVSYRPITDESNLIYLDWVNANRRRVSEMTGGRVGYIHIPDMGANGIREFIKWYYGQIRLEGLIVDVRANGGGNVSRMLIERLRRRLLALGYSRTNDEATTYPDQVFLGPMAALLNENSASDGDIFPAMFREAGLGPLVGKRSWGGVVGITNRGPLIDGGVVNVPEFGFANVKGEWIIEGYGVDPDIEVDNDPKSVIEGRDAQLERAVAEVMKKLKDKPVKLPPPPPGPVKTR